jgi:hypothetical protein
MREKILKAAYDKGLYAQGTPDSWDEDALFQFGKYLVEECIDAVEQMDTFKGGTTYDKDLVLCSKVHCIQAIERKFK